jgi:AraC family transcriptional regulator of adaptative response/methylated-DNA-[protein]-cysteine methyltransferase
MMTLPTEDQMYRAVIRRDAEFDGVFFTAVKTTGIFCRPTCASRKPRRTSVEFFSNPREAMLAGYRPCKRCRPMDMIGKPPAWVRQLSDTIDREPAKRIRASDLRAMDIDPSRAARWYKQHYGMTFQAYHRARRMGMALASVRSGIDLNHAGLRNGFESASGFRDAFARTFGTPPGRASTLACLFARWLDTPLGAMLAIANDDGLCLLEFVDRRMLETQLATVRKRFGCAIVPGENDHLEQAADELVRYFDGSLTQFKVPLVMRGTPFQVKAWQRLMEIPCGETLSYAQMARDIGSPGAQRAVGKANGDNRIAIIIPCHRVVRSDGTLCGYGGGLWRKKWLLEHETNHIK